MNGSELRRALEPLELSCVRLLAQGLTDPEEIADALRPSGGTYIDRKGELVPRAEGRRPLEPYEVAETIERARVKMAQVIARERREAEVEELRRDAAAAEEANRAAGRERSIAEQVEEHGHLASPAVREPGPREALDAAAEEQEVRDRLEAWAQVGASPEEGSWGARILREAKERRDRLHDEITARMRDLAEAEAIMQAIEGRAEPSLHDVLTSPAVEPTQEPVAGAPLTDEIHDELPGTEDEGPRAAGPTGGRLSAAGEVAAERDQRIVDYLREHGETQRRDAMAALGIPSGSVGAIIARLTKKGRVVDRREENPDGAAPLSFLSVGPAER